MATGCAIARSDIGKFVRSPRVNRAASGERQEEYDTFLSGEPPRGASMMAGSIFAPEAAPDHRGSRLAAVAESIDERVERGRRHD